MTIIAQDSIFQISVCASESSGGVTSACRTAFCVQHDGEVAFATARHVFTPTKMQPDIEIAIRAQKEQWSRVRVKIILHPTADLAIFYIDSSTSRIAHPLPIAGANSLTDGAPIEVLGYPAFLMQQGLLLEPDKYQGLGATPSIKSYGRHSTRIIQSTLPEISGLSGSPVFRDGSDTVVGNYSSGYGAGARLVDANQIAEV